MTTNTVRRKIHFFHLKLLELPGGSKDFQKHLDTQRILSEIASFPFLGDHQQSRFLNHQNNDVSFLNDIDATVAKQIRGRFALSRRSALPNLETGGVLSPLNIPANSGLAEITHFIYFPNKEVIGIEFNFNGLRPTAMKNYLLEKSRNTHKPFEYIELNPILNKDLDLQLQDMGELNLFSMEISRNDLAIVEELDRDLHSAFKSAADVSDAETVEVTLKKKKYSRGGFPLPFSKEKIKELLSTGDNRQKINRLSTYAESKSDNSSKRFDLLEDKMIRSKKVTTIDPRSKAVDSTSMFSVIEEAYTELEDNF